MIEVIPQPRVDTLVTDAASGEARRRTEYTGTAWIDGRVESAGLMLRHLGPKGIVTPNKDEVFYVPDSLPYTGAELDRAQLTLNTSLAASGEVSAIISSEAGFVADPSGTPTWIQVRVIAHSGSPCAIAYRVVALVPPEAVASP